MRVPEINREGGLFEYYSLINKAVCRSNEVLICSEFGLKLAITISRILSSINGRWVLCFARFHNHYTETNSVSNNERERRILCCHLTVSTQATELFMRIATQRQQ
jgi:hypothetical protein